MRTSEQLQQAISDLYYLMQKGSSHQVRQNAALQRKYLLGELVLQKQYEARKEGRVN